MRVDALFPDQMPGTDHVSKALSFMWLQRQFDRYCLDYHVVIVIISTILNMLYFIVFSVVAPCCLVEL
jgi:hypothetical protein